MTSSSFQAQERSAVPINPEQTRVKPQARHLRSISFGPARPARPQHHLSDKDGTANQSGQPGTGAYLVVEVAHRGTHLSFGGGGDFIGYSTGRNVSIEPTGEVVSITYRFGSLICSVAHRAHVSRRCPSPPTHQKTLSIPPGACIGRCTSGRCSSPPKAAAGPFLLDPCYRAEVEFQAPYAVTNASSEYAVEASSRCKNARPNGWG